MTPTPFNWILKDLKIERSKDQASLDVIIRNPGARFVVTQTFVVFPVILDGKLLEVIKVTFPSRLLEHLDSLEEHVTRNFINPLLQDYATRIYQTKEALKGFDQSNVTPLFK